LSQDWGVSKQEAEEMLQAWYNARPEVRNWQEATKAYAAEHGITRTLMGRYRQLPISSDRKIFGGAQRASINTVCSSVISRF
jgi:DNA polymerase I